MKSFILILTTLFSLQALAAEPSYSLFSSISEDSYTVSPLCPEDLVCVTDGTVIDLKYTIQCTEGLVSFTHQALEKDGELHIFISAVKGHNPPQDFSCQGFEEVDKNITLINQFGKVIIHNLL